MENIIRLKLRITNHVFQRVFLIQESNFDRYWFIVVIFTLQFVLGPSAFLLGHIQFNTLLQNYLKIWLNMAEFEENSIMIISIGISFVIFGYLCFLYKISIKNHKTGIFGKWVNQEMIRSIMASMTYLMSGFSLWMLKFAVHCLVYSFKLTNSYYSIILSILGVFQIIFSVVFSYFYEIALVSMSFKSMNLMVKFSTNKSFVFKMVGYLGAILIAQIQIDQKYFQILCASLILLSYTYQIYEEIYCFKYHSQFTSRVNQIFTILNFMLSILVVLYVLYPLPIIQNNNLAILLFSTIFSTFALNSYQSHQVNTILISDIVEFKATNQINLFLRSFLRLSNGQQSNLQIIKLSLLEKHTKNCIDTACYCRGKIIELDEKIKYVSYQKWKQIDKLFNKNDELILLSKFYVFECFQYYPLILVYLQNSSQTSYSLQLEYLKYHLKSQIQSYIQKISQERDLAQTQAPLVLQKKLQQVMQKMKKCSNSFLQKYKYLCKGLCRITEIEQASSVQLQIMKQIEQFYQQHKIQYKRSTQFSLVLHFYFSKIFILNARANEIRRHLINQKFQTKLLSDFKIGNFKEHIFKNNCCTFESSFADKNYGTITNVSKNVSKLFGANRNTFIGKNINKIFPTFLREEHDRIVKKWYQCGRWDKIGALKQAYCVGQNNQYFSSIVYLKIGISIDNQFRFYAMVMKNDKNDNLLVLNQNQQIEYYGQQIKELLCFNAKKYLVYLIFRNLDTIQFQGMSQTETKLILRGFKDAENKFMIENSKEFKQKNEIGHGLLDSNNISKYFGSGIVQHQCKFIIRKNSLGSKQFLSFQLLSVIENGYSKSALYLSNAESILEGSNIQTKTMIGEEQKRIEQLACESSVNSSQNSDSYSLVKIIKTYFHLFLATNEIKSRKINLTTYFILFFAFLIIGQAIAIHYYYLVGLNSVYEVCFADGAVSDNMQLIEFLYGNTLLMKQFQNDTTGLSLIHNSSKDIQNYAYELLSYDMQYLFKKVVQISNLPYYKYLQFPIEWKFSSQSVQIQSNQFLEYFYYMARQSWKKNPTQNILNTFMNNFPELKRINHQNLAFYQDQTLNVINQLDTIFFVNLATMLIFSVSLGLSLHCFYYKKHKKILNCCMIYSLLSQQQLEQLKQYYTDIRQYLTISIKDKNMGPEDFNYPIAKGNKTISNKLIIMNDKKYLSFIWIIMLAVLINTINIISNVRTRQIFEPSTQMVYTMSKLMDSENYLIQSYFEMKAYFIIGNQSKTIEQLTNQLLMRVQYDQLLFNIIVKKSLQLFSKYDPNYESDFINLLIDNICDIVDKNITEFQRWQCKFELYESTIDLGVVGGMNQFYRQVQNSLNMMKTIDISKFDSDTYFKTKTVRQTDKNIFFMFKMYQTTQQRIMLSLSVLIQTDFKNRFIWLFLGTILVLMVAFYWIYMIPNERISIGNMYGFFLLIPQGIIAQSKNLLKKIDEIANEQ